MSSEYVIYVSYGSNMLTERFLAYIAGGSITGNARTYYGCRNKVLPLKRIPLKIPGRVLFSGDSKLWGNGGVAYYNSTLEGETLAVGYLIHKEQFEDVVAQENGLEAGSISVDFAELVDAKELNIGGKYGRMLLLGMDSGTPLITFTSPDYKSIESYNHPSSAYLNVIRQGLLESFPPEEVETYLKTIACPL